MFNLKFCDLFEAVFIGTEYSRQGADGLSGNTPQGMRRSADFQNIQVTSVPDPSHFGTDPDPGGPKSYVSYGSGSGILQVG